MHKTGMFASFDISKILTKARRLVPFLPPQPISPHGALTQDTCLIYSRLPPELRLVIWESYIGAHAVHIYRRGTSKKLCAKECSGWDTDDRGPHHNRCGSANVQCNHITLLLTCKRMYFDFIHILYEHTAFDFSHGPATAGVMLKRLPATHLALITQVHIKWLARSPLDLDLRRPGRDEKIWIDLWEALAAMKRLKWLRVELMPVVPMDGPVWVKREHTMCSVLRKVTSPEFFELVLPWPAGADAREETLPCSIVRKVPAYGHLFLV
ncbi:hypothetical protein F5X68DRAFT_260061 [Plectosphaerella plurivora]|uniref:DUF7730 domain-containing protein n=1 Tax=Plectosphaerella plurivora TaxID=936078 RepID=A0A9P8VGD7_9PEZI|nr:hypothetical protein F5X68DRAFT_260061 [Plectosphaerella plurivora]